MEDIVLVNAYKQGDTSSFSELYEKYVDDIYRFVFRKTWDTNTSEDLTSEIWIKICSSIQKYQEQSGATFKSWIYRIAHNSVIDHYRKQKEHLDIDEVEPPSISPDFAKSVDDSTTLKKVTDYLHTLSSREQEIVFLRVWDDLDYKEISEILWISVDNCKKIYSRSIKKVQANVATMLLFILLFL